MYMMVVGHRPGSRWSTSGQEGKVSNAKINQRLPVVRHFSARDPRTPSICLPGSLALTCTIAGQIFYYHVHTHCKFDNQLQSHFPWLLPRRYPTSSFSPNRPRVLLCFPIANRVPQLHDHLNSKHEISNPHRTHATHTTHSTITIDTSTLGSSSALLS